MKVLRIFLALYFAFCAVVLFFGAFTGPWKNPKSGDTDLIYVVIRHLVPAILGIVFGIATRVAASGRLTAQVSGKGWAVTASLLSLLITTGFPLFYIRHGGASAFWGMEEFFGIPTAIGIAGLLAFSLQKDHARWPTH